MVKYLLERGADVSAQCTNGYTPLLYAENIEVIKILVEYGAEVNTKNSDGKIKLRKAIKQLEHFS